MHWSPLVSMVVSGLPPRETAACYMPVIAHCTILTKSSPVELSVWMTTAKPKPHISTTGACERRPPSSKPNTCRTLFNKNSNKDLWE